MAQLEADNQAYSSQCKQLSLGMEDVVKDSPHDALQKKYLEAVSAVAGSTSQLSSITASQKLLQVLLHYHALEQLHGYERRGHR